MLKKWQCLYTPPFPYPFSCQWIMGLLHVLAVVNSVAKNMGVHMCLWDLGFSYFGVCTQKSDHMVIIFLTLLRTSIVFSPWLHWFTFLPIVHKHSKFSTSSPAPAVFCLCCCVVSSHPDGYEGCLEVLFCFSAVISYVEHLFIEHLFIFFGERTVQVFCPFLKSLVFCVVEFYGFSTYPGYQIPYPWSDRWFENVL